MTTITTLPTPPSRSDPANFASRADAFLGALPTFGDQANLVAAEVNADAAAANTSKIQAEAAAAAALAVSNTQVWVSGTTYTIGVVRYSPINFLTYRRKTAGAGTTDPSADATNWQLVAGTGDVTLTATQTLTNKTLTSPVLNQATLATPVSTGSREIRVAMPANNIDLNTGNYFTKTITATTTVTVSNVPASGIAVSFILDLTNGGSFVITWFANVKWIGGTVPTLTPTGRDILAFFTHDNGTTWNGLLLARDIK
jgi:hypothetical protein